MSKTLSMLLGITILLSTNTQASIKNIKKQNHSETKCLSDMIYHEARGESTLGQTAVAVVTINRAKSGKYPSNLCDVIYQQGQYSWTKKRVAIKNTTLYNKISQLGANIYETYHLDDKLPKHLSSLESALFFSSAGFNKKHYKFVTKIGNHKFYESRK
jgi:N-acetylmuramoyl-L-alanine amidase